MKQKGREAIMYVAHPTRMRQESEALCDFVWKKGYAPVNPFMCGEYRHFEGGIISREASLEFCLNIQKGCGITGVFGISEGVLGEIQDRLKWDPQKNFRFFYGFDSQWDSEYEKLKEKYGDILSQFRKHQLVVLVGPRAAGKTHLINGITGGTWADLYNIRRVRNTTTRKPRDDEDKKSYNFISQSEFLEGIDNDEFLEHDEYAGNFYGCSWPEIRRVLRNSDGIFAITPAGARALYEYRFELNPFFVVLKPASDEVLLRNLRKRGDNEQTIAHCLATAKDFVLLPEIPHQVLEMTGTDKDFEAFQYLLNYKSDTHYGFNFREILRNAEKREYC